MSTNQVKKPRPYWHVDAKWITGIFLLLLLNITFLLVWLVQVTSAKQGINLLATTLASSFSFESGGLEATQDIEILQQKIDESPTGAWQPIPGLNILVRQADINGKTPREVRLWFFRQMAEPAYYNGSQGLMDLATDDETRTKMEGGLGLLGVISAATHRKLMIFLVVSGLVTGLFLVLLIFFSHRSGRLGSPGCAIFLAAIPGLLLFAGLRGWLEKSSQAPPPLEPTILTRYTQLAVDVLPDTLQKAALTYGILILIGFGLMLIALLGSIFFREHGTKDPS